MLSLAGTLRTAERHLPVELVSRDARNRLERLARRLPAALTQWLYLESRLSEEVDQVDLIVAITATGRDILAGRNPATSLPRELRSNGIWARLEELCREWADPASPLNRCIECLWLEFDVPSDRVSLPLPGVFVGFTQTTHTGNPVAERLALVEQVLRTLQGDALNVTMPCLATCFEHLPIGASVPYVGALLPRGGDTVRLCVTGLSDQALLRYLHAIGWPGDSEELAEYLARSTRTRIGAALPEVALLHLDVGREVGPRLGMEYVFARREQIRGRLMETAFLDDLVARGLCTSRKRQVFTHWSGCSREILPHELWPSLVTRRVNHVKVVHEAGCPVQAKSYLSMHHHYFPRAAAHCSRLSPTEVQ